MLEFSFIHNRYKKIYDALCSRALTRSVSTYTEGHHIIPKSLGGKNTKNNLVRLTAREHYVAHLCLVRCTTGVARAKMIYAVMSFINGRGIGRSKTRLESFKTVRFNSHVFERLRVENRENIRRSKLENRLSTITRERMRQSQLKRYSNPEERIKTGVQSRISNADPLVKEKNRLAQMGNKRALGNKLSLAARQKISQSHKGKSPSPEHRQRLREAWYRNNPTRTSSGRY